MSDPTEPDYRAILETTIENISHIILHLGAQVEVIKREAEGLLDYQRWLIRQVGEGTDT
jgi:uncharacterized protein YoxC